MSLLSDLTHLEGLYRELWGLAQGCANVLSEERLDDLEGLWARRRRLFKRLEAAGRRMQPVFDDWPAALAGLGPAQQEQGQALVESLERTARQILELDRAAMKRLKELMRQVDQDLGRLTQGQRLIKAYGNKGAESALPSSLSRLG